MKRKSRYYSGRSNVSTTPEKEVAVVMTSKKEENVKPEIARKEATFQAAGGVMNAAKTEMNATVSINKQELVKVNVGAGCSSFK